MELEVVNIKGEKTGKKVELSDAVFGVEPNDHAIYLEVKRYLAAQRQGTHKTKERGEISGSTRKMRKQKGSGMARVGSIKSPLFPGGGRVFGPKPRDYDFKLNKKVKTLAKLSALSYKVKNNQLLIVEDFSVETPKTRDFVEILKNLDADSKKTLIVTSKIDKNLLLSARNIPNASVITVDSLNTYSLMNCTALILAESGVESINKTFNV
jgi:large subunit ribosomal protein L4